MRIISILMLVLAAPTTNAQQSFLVDWSESGEEAIEHLVDLVQINTTNPPGNETRAVEYLEEALAAEGIRSETFALEEDRANLVARIKGNGSKRPILIMGHTDVVGVRNVSTSNWIVMSFSWQKPAKRAHLRSVSTSWSNNISMSLAPNSCSPKEGRVS
jgi:hypothetical protein